MNVFWQGLKKTAVGRASAVAAAAASVSACIVVSIYLFIAFEDTHFFISFSVSIPTYLFLPSIPLSVNLPIYFYHPYLYL